MAHATRTGMFVSFLEFQAGSCLYVNKVTIAVKASLRFIGTCHDLGCRYSVYIQTRQVFLGRCNEVWLHRFRSPPFGSLFILSPLHTSFLFFSFMSSLASCPVISSLSFFCVHTARPLFCACATYFQFRFQVAQVLTMRWVVIGCSCALGSFSLQPHTFLSRLVLFMSSFFCLTARTPTLLP